MGLGFRIDLKLFGKLNLDINYHHTKNQVDQTTPTQSVVEGYRCPLDSLECPSFKDVHQIHQTVLHLKVPIRFNRASFIYDIYQSNQSVFLLRCLLISLMCPFINLIRVSFIKVVFIQRCPLDSLDFPSFKDVHYILQIDLHLNMSINLIRLSFIYDFY